MTDIEQRYFERVCEIWQPIQAGKTRVRRIIPFCTPLVPNPTALVVGTNHSFFDDPRDNKRFDKTKRLQRDKIADRYALSVPQTSMYLTETHVRFVKNLQRVCKRARLAIDDTWIGTNRCAIQTGDAGLGDLPKVRGFRLAQAQMDRVMLDLIEELRPTNVLLFGKHAAGLFGGEIGLADIEPFEWSFQSGFSAWIIPTHHPSRNNNHSKIVEHLFCHFRGKRLE